MPLDRALRRLAIGRKRQSHRLRGGRVGAGVTLRERKARCHTAGHLAEIVLLLIITPGEQDGKGTEPVGAQNCRRRGATARNGLDHGRRRAQASACATKSLRDEQAREFMLDQAVHVLGRIALVAVELGGERRKMLPREAIGQVATAPCLLAQRRFPDDCHSTSPASRLSPYPRESAFAIVNALQMR